MRDRLSRGSSRRARVSRLTESSLFESCERRLVLSAQLLYDVLSDQAIDFHGQQNSYPSSDSIPLQPHLSEAHAASGWNQMQEQFGLTGAGQTVAVIDSGIAWDHVALGEGYGPGYRVVGGWDFTEENDAQPYDDGPLGFHGTHVSGIIGSSDPTHTGVAPDVDLVALRVFNDMGQGQLSWVERALQWVHDNRDSFENPITTVNLSLGTTWNADTVPQWATLEDELQMLSSEGILVTASAGNSFQEYNAPGLSYPAASQYVLPVASVDDDGDLSSFSQRNGRVLAAPGRDIVSTVPDHVLGRDGKIDDFTSASGTSMAAPYVAGASVLVRQAMEMVGLTTINASTIADHLHATADSVYDALTGASYSRLNLDNAIDSLIPDDSVGDTLQSATQLSLSQEPIDGWLNHLGDQDIYRFTATSSGNLQLDASSQWVDSLQWSLSTGGQTVGAGSLGTETMSLDVGRTYELSVSASSAIGSFSIGLDFTEVAGGQQEPVGEPPTGSPVDLGAVRYYESSSDAAASYRAQATRDGTWTVQWTNADSQVGSMALTDAAGHSFSSASWSDGALRVDMQVQEGDWIDIRLPGSPGDSGQLAIANVVSKAGTTVDVEGTVQGDNISLDLRNGLTVGFGSIAYSYSPGEVGEVHIDGYGNNDHLQIVGSTQADTVDLRPAGSTIANSQIHVAVVGVEEISYSSGGGADRAYLYDSDTNDTLRASPGQAELVGAGYRFDVEQVNRIFIHATGGGQDYAYLYDSAGDDRLSVRPQFSSMSGEGFFNYVRGFERVYAYANAGGFDEAQLYDSEGDDRFLTSGVSASIVGPGFSSYTRSFEQVHAQSYVGGNDRATLYGSGQQTDWQQGSDFISFREEGWNREARGFGSVETYVAGQPHQLGAAAMEAPAQLAGAQPLVPDSSPVVPSPAVGAGQPDFTGQPDVTGQPPVESFAVLAEPAAGGWTDEAVYRSGGDWASDTSWADPTWVASPSDPYDVGHAIDMQPELELAEQVDQLGEWLAESMQLVEGPLLSSPELELNILDEIFRQRDELE